MVYLSASMYIFTCRTKSEGLTSVAIGEGESCWCVLTVSVGLVCCYIQFS